MIKVAIEGEEHFGLFAADIFPLTESLFITANFGEDRGLFHFTKYGLKCLWAQKNTEVHKYVIGMLWFIFCSSLSRLKASQRQPCTDIWCFKCKKIFFGHLTTTIPLVWHCKKTSRWSPVMTYWIKNSESVSWISARNWNARSQSSLLGIKMSCSDSVHSWTANDTNIYLPLKSAVWVNQRKFV